MSDHIIDQISAENTASGRGLLYGTGEIADRIRAFPWHSTPLGPLDTWSPELLNTVELLLASPLPSLLYWGPEFTFLYNDRCLPLLAGKHPQALGQPAHAVWQEIWKITEEQLTRVFHSGNTLSLENLPLKIMRNGAEEQMYWTYTATPVRDRQGRVRGVLNLAQDTTAAVQAQSYWLFQAQANRVLQSIGDAVIVTDGESRITRMNPVAEHLTGWSAAEAEGLPLDHVFRIVSEDTRLPVESPAAKVRRKGSVIGLANHTILLGKGGQETHIDDSAAPIWGDRGELAGVVLVFHDVEDRRVLEKRNDAAFRELRNTYGQLQLAMEFAGQGSFSFDASTGLLSGDAIVQELFEQDQPSGPPEYWIAKVHEEDRDRVAEAFAAAVAGEKPYDIEHRIVRLDGVRWLQARARPLSQPDEPVLLTGVCEDITIRKLQTDALRQTEKLAAVGRLAASIAHEINNPLESVTNLLYLARTSQNMEQVQDYLDTAERELRRVSVISNQTLRFYKQSTNAREVTCSDLFEGVLSIYQGRLVNSHVIVEKRKRAKRSFRCFEGEIRQVLNNLVGNAIDAMHPQGGRLILRSRESHDWRTGKPGVALIIADTGTGMPPNVVRKIFDAFYTTKGIGGTGLGLWLSKEIVDRHNGTLLVRSSQNEAHSGTVFSLFLPFDAVER